MKNNLLLGLTPEQPVNIDEILPNYNDLLELIAMNKIHASDINDIAEKVSAALGHDCEEYAEDYDECEEYDYLDNCSDSLAHERLANNMLYEMESANLENSHRLITAGYTDCMEEAIRFLVEEENISPEHPVVLNLKAHLERSKERIVETAFDLENNNRHYSSLHYTDNQRLVNSSPFSSLDETPSQCLQDNLLVNSRNTG